MPRLAANRDGAGATNNMGAFGFVVRAAFVTSITGADTRSC